MALTPLLIYFWIKKATAAKIRTLGLLGQKTDGLAGSFKKVAHNRANHPGQHGAKFRANILETFSQSFAVGFRPLVIELITALIVTPAARGMSLSHHIFLKISLIISKRGSGLSISLSLSFSLLALFLCFFCFSSSAATSFFAFSK